MIKNSTLKSKRKYHHPLLSVIYIESEQVISSSIQKTDKVYDVDARAPKYRTNFNNNFGSNRNND